MTLGLGITSQKLRIFGSNIEVTSSLFQRMQSKMMPAPSSTSSSIEANVRYLLVTFCAEDIFGVLRKCNQLLARSAEAAAAQNLSQNSSQRPFTTAKQLAQEALTRFQFLNRPHKRCAFEFNVVFLRC